MHINSLGGFSADDFRPTEYRPGLDMDLLLKRVHTQGLAVLSGFPADPEELLAFGRRLGTPSRKPAYGGAANSPKDGDAFGYIGDVRLMTDIEAGRRRPTQDRAEVRMHTARSFAVNRPRYFVLLMADPGRRTERGQSGESVYTSIDHACAALHRRFPDTAAEDLEVLASTPVPWTLPHAPENAARTPVLQSTSPRTFRYWQGIADDIPAEAADSRLAAALTRLDQVINDPAVQAELVAEAGDLVLLDNDRVAHGRRPFPAFMDDAGTVPSTRQVYSVHVFAPGQETAE